MSNIEALFPHCVQPVTVLDNVSQRINEIDHLYIVMVTKTGHFVTYGSGDLSRMSDAALLMTRLATMNVAERQEDLDDED